MNLCRQPIHQKEVFTDAMEKAFLEWIRTLVSCLDEAKNNIVAAHVRRVSQGAGIGKKPKLFAIPLTEDQHNYQHRKGERHCLFYYTGRSFTVKEAKKWFDDKAFFYREIFLDTVWSGK